MKRKVAGVVAGLALLAIPASSLGGATASQGTTYGSSGALVAGDSAGDNPAAAVARVTLKSFGKVFYRVTSKPRGVPIAWSITTRCVKGSLIDYWPGPGDHRTTTKRAPFGGTFPVPLANPDYCTFAVAGQTYKYQAGKKVTVKIFKDQ